MFNKILTFILVLSVLVCSFSLVVSAAETTPSIDVFKVTKGSNINGSSLPFTYSDNSLSFTRDGTFFWVYFVFSGIDSSELLQGSFSFSVFFDGFLNSTSSYYLLNAFNGVSYETIGSVSIMSNRVEFFIDSGTLLSDYEHFAFRCAVSNAPDNLCSFTFSNIFVNVSPNTFDDFLSDVSYFFSSILGFIVSIFSFIFNSPLFYFFSFIIILFILYLFYRVKRHG